MLYHNPVEVVNGTKLSPSWFRAAQHLGTFIARAVTPGGEASCERDNIRIEQEKLTRLMHRYFNGRVVLKDNKCQVSNEVEQYHVTTASDVCINLSASSAKVTIDISSQTGEAQIIVLPNYDTEPGWLMSRLWLKSVYVAGISCAGRTSDGCEGNYDDTIDAYRTAQIAIQEINQSFDKPWED